jgi:RNA polymerase sigma-70 factor (ECF subfamily)
MDASAREALEAEVRRLCEAGDPRAASTAALRGYGPEIYGLLRALMRREEDADEAFAVFGEDLWRGLPGFAWSSTLRTWAYAVARNAASRFHRGARKRAANVPLSEAPEALAIAEKVRTETASYLKTDRRTRVQELRATLPEEDQMLLILRIDRGLSWNELACVMADGELRGEALTRESARLRKRFQLVKEQFVEMGRKEGLVGRSSRE